MASFELTQKPPAVRVRKALLVQLESYILEQAARITSKTIDELRADFKIDIIDALGTETLRSAGEFKGDKFPDSVKEVRVKLGRWTSLALEVGLDFTKARDASWIRISYTGSDARETVTGLFAGLRRVLETERTYSWLFRPAFVPDFFSLWCAITLLQLLAPAALYVKGLFWRIPFVLLTLAMLLFVLGWFLKPFSSFDSRRQKTFDEIWKWLSLGILGFIVFGTLFPFLRKLISGI